MKTDREYHSAASNNLNSFSPRLFGSFLECLFSLIPCLPHTGFIASHVAILFCKKYPQYNIVVYDKLDYCACFENLTELLDLPNFKFVKVRIVVVAFVRC